jgi:hypothetical protein
MKSLTAQLVGQGLQKAWDRYTVASNLPKTAITATQIRKTATTALREDSTTTREEEIRMATALATQRRHRRRVL